MCQALGGDIVLGQTQTETPAWSGEVVGLVAGACPSVLGDVGGTVFSLNANIKTGWRPTACPLSARTLRGFGHIPMERNPKAQRLCYSETAAHGLTLHVSFQTKGLLLLPWASLQTSGRSIDIRICLQCVPSRTEKGVWASCPWPSPGRRAAQGRVAPSSRAWGLGLGWEPRLGQALQGLWEGSPACHRSAQELPGSLGPTLAQQQLINIHLETKASLKS